MVVESHIRTVIWDWNGTLLNDIDLCISTINNLLFKRNLPLIDVEKYKEVFSFPVKDYYERIGFDFQKEPFEIPAREFIDAYNRAVVSCNLHSEVLTVLEKLKQQDKQQIILSAMEQSALEMTLNQHQIMNYFDIVSGLDNHYAVSKLDNGKALIKKLQLNPSEICLIGDTTHDFEVAEALGCKCILVADGHQSEERLKETGCDVIGALSELVIS